MPTASNPGLATQLISICGVDGTGKTTLIQQLRKQGEITLRSPQVHESGNFTISKHSSALEELSQMADASGDLVTKACILFLAMSLQPTAERELTANRPKRLFRERDPLLDLVVYSPLYLRLLKPEQQFSPAKHETLIHEIFEVQKNLFPGMTLSELPKALITFFSQPQEAWLTQLVKEWRILPASQIILLHADEATLQRRMLLKEKGQQREFHEQLPLLLMLQSGFEQAGKALHLSFGFKFNVCDLQSSDTIDEVSKRFVNLL